MEYLALTFAGIHLRLKHLPLEKLIVIKSDPSYFPSNSVMESLSEFWSYCS